MVTLLTNRKRSFRRSCPSLSLLSQGTSCCKSSCYLVTGHKNIKKGLAVSLKPCKRYPLPLPKSVPHLPRTFFTEQLFLNRVFNESTESKFPTKEIFRCETTVEIVKSKLILEGFKSGKSPLGKPKIPAPDFKLRETRPTVTHRAVKNVLSCQQKPQPNQGTINILINNKPSDEKPVLDKNNSAKIDKNTKKQINKIFNTKQLEVNVLSESYQNPFFNPEKLSVENEIKRNFSSIKRPHQKILENNTPTYQSGNPIFRSESGDYFFKNINNVQGCRSKAQSHFLYKETNNNNKLSICKLNSVFYWDKKFDENCKENIESKTLSAHVHSKDINSILHDRNNKLLEPVDKTTLKSDSYLQSSIVTKQVLPIMQDNRQIPQTPAPTLEEIENKTRSDFCCRCSAGKDKAGKNTWNFVHCTKYESLFFGPTLDETIMNLIYCIRLILEKIGILTPKEKNMNSCCCCNGKLEPINPNENLDNNLDVIKWLHDEYLNLAKDVAKANSALEHNCPCTKDNCPVTLQSRRYVLDRLAELLEKKQELESAYRKKENDKKNKKKLG